MDGTKKSMTGSRHHRVHAMLTLVVAVVAGVILIPLVRSQPESVHTFANGLHDWQRIVFGFLLSLLYAYTMFKLFSPRLAHLRFLWSHPPTWFAWILGVILVGWIDVMTGLNPSGYRATWQDWVFYAGGSTALVAAYRFLLSPTGVDLKTLHQRALLVLTSPFRPAPKPNSDTASPSAHTLRLQNVAEAKWEDIEAWLCSDAPAEYDFLNNRAVADRLTRMLMDGTRSIGLVGPFGAGKTSIVKWVVDEVSAGKQSLPRLFVSQHSCWGFETSASSIHEMLAGAIKAVEAEIDTFHVGSLPESYRQTFSAGGEWIDTISNLVLGKRDPSDQFKSLSELLGNLNARLVFVIEDLDRNDSRSFDIQEVLAFLEQLKEHENVSFILTGGLSSSRKIDFAKLCDHIEYLRTIEIRYASGMVDRVCGRCADPTAFRHEALGDPNRNYVWNAMTALLMRDYEELSLPQALASLLNTPRALRHALGRTWSGWKTLHGEIDLNHLLAVNVLRFGAPECFLFLVRRWDRLNSPPSPNPSLGRDRIDRIRQAIIKDWNDTIQRVEWNPTAALVVMEFILPATKVWLVDDRGYSSSGNAPQGVHHERYWRRAVNEAFDPSDVRDQVVIRDMRRWLECPSPDSELITGLVTSSDYSDVWEDLAGGVLANQPDRILAVCEHTLARIGREHGAAASYESQGFTATWRFANRRVSHQPANRDWLMERISDAASVSIELAHSLWHFYGTPSQHPLLRREDGDAVRQHVIQKMRSILVNGEALERLIDSRYPYGLSGLVFDSGDHNPDSVGDVPAWTWMAPVLLDSLRRGNTTVAVTVSSLMTTRESGTRREPWAVNPEILFAFFPTNAEEVVERLSESASRIVDAEQQQLVRAITESAKLAIQERNSGAEAK